MSLNFCEENPDQSTSNKHCFHVTHRVVVSRKVERVYSRCCWCGDRIQEDAYRQHGPLLKQEKTK